MSFKGITCATAVKSTGHITAADDAAIFQSIFGSDGVFNTGNKFKSTVISNNKVRVSDGVLCVGGHVGRTAYGTYNDMTIENGASGYNRNDIICAKFLTGGDTDTFTLVVKKGTATTGTAADPALTQGVLYNNATTREYPLWRVKLTGLSITAVEQMFTVVPTIPELEAEIGSLNTNLAPADGGSKSRMGQLMIDSVAGSFSDSASKSFTLSYTPINNYAVLCTAVTSPSTNIALKNIAVSGKTLTINLTGVTGNMRFAVLYMTKDEIS